jgi:hypothetical protein
MTNPMPAETLERRASEQRRRLHNSVAELRTSVRQRLDVNKIAGEYVWPAAAIAALCGLVVGWGIVGIFTRD